MMEGSPQKLLVACDFDGTLAPLVDDPDQATALPEAVAALRRLAAVPGTTVCVISGRRLAELRERFGEEPFILIGEHGADEGDLVFEEPSSLSRARHLVEAAAAATPGSRAEHKRSSVVFHYRAVGEPEEVVAELRQRLADLEGVSLLEGKAVLEATVSNVDKGEAIERLRHGFDAVVFCGDDLTDESVFSRLRPPDLAIKVGPGPTAATQRLPDPQAVAEFLTRLAAWREGA